MNRFYFFIGASLLLLASGCEVTDEPAAATAPAAGPAAAQSDIARGELAFTTDLAQGLSTAQQDGKPLLVFFTARQCHFCHEMARESFTNRQVISLSQQFVCVLVDADTQPDLCQRYQVRGFPTIQFISPRGVPLNRVVGKRSSQEIMQQMQTALQAIAATQNRTGIERL
ncbi:MAG TPA: thioredoxin family protein [Pirellulales bacterium]|jgi:thiol:disulfide interchange protein|nr:thioredoxin family protein [Pirellulales bacterium]